LVWLVHEFGLGESEALALMDAVVVRVMILVHEVVYSSLMIFNVGSLLEDEGTTAGVGSWAQLVLAARDKAEIMSMDVVICTSGTSVFVQVHIVAFSYEFAAAAGYTSAVSRAM
jgi:hypothetical protein